MNSRTIFSHLIPKCTIIGIFYLVFLHRTRIKSATNSNYLNIDHPLRLFCPHAREAFDSLIGILTPVHYL